MAEQVSKLMLVARSWSVWPMELEQISYNTVIDHRTGLVYYQTSKGEIKWMCPYCFAPTRKNKRRVRFYRIFGGKKNK